MRRELERLGVMTSLHPGGSEARSSLCRGGCDATGDLNKRPKHGKSAIRSSRGLPHPENNTTKLLKRNTLAILGDCEGVREWPPPVGGEVGQHKMTRCPKCCNAKRDGLSDQKSLLNINC
jgi:hypothetical protein